MTNQHPITPPPELVEQWVRMFEYLPDKQVFSEVAQWGADQELEACCAQISQCHLLTAEQRITIAEYLHYCRRPKPPSLKEEALEALEEIGQVGSALVRSRSDTIRRALESIND